MVNRILLLLLLFMMALGCKEPEQEVLAPEEIVSRMTERMTAMNGFHFTFDISGAPAFLDESLTLSLGSAEGFFVAPDKAIAAVRVLTPGLVTEVNFISIGQEQWLSGLVTEDWVELPPGWGFNPAMLVDAENGILASLATDLSVVNLVDTTRLEDGPQEDLYLISGKLDSSRISEMSQGLIGSQGLDVRLWIAPQTFELYRAELADKSKSNEEQPTTWQVNFDQFDQVVDISRPSP